MKTRILSLLLLTAMVLSILPAGVFARGTGTFVLVAEKETGLIIVPEFIHYSQGQTVREALMACDHSFTGLSDDWVTEIDGESGNFTRSDEKGNFALNTPASEVKFFRFSEETDSKPSEGLQRLMTAMANYGTKTADVQAAAKEAYDSAYVQFVGLDSNAAISLAITLEQAIAKYETAQAGQKYPITFTDGSAIYTNTSIRAENAYGKVWEDDGDGVLELPADLYSFSISRDGLSVSGRIAVTKEETVSATLPTEEFLVLDNFRLSGSFGTDYNEETKFTDEEFSLGVWKDRRTEVTVSDTFHGSVYTYAEYDRSLLSYTPELSVHYVSAKTGEKVEVRNFPFQSLQTGTDHVLAKGALGNTLIYRVTTQETDGYVYTQDYTVVFRRMPTLASIQVKDQEGVSQTATTPIRGDVTDYTYRVVDTVTSVTVTAQPLSPDYKVTIQGKNAAEGVTVPLENSEETVITISVEGNDFRNTYTLRIRPGEGRNLSFVTASRDVTLEVVNKNGEVLPYEKFKEGKNGNRYQYILVPGETYSYVATSGTYYHVASQFTMEDVADSTIQVDVPTEDWLTELSFGSASGSKYKGNLPLTEAFDPGIHRYSVSFVDTSHIPYLWIKSGITLTSASALYHQQFASDLYHGVPYSVALTSGKTAGTKLNRFLMDENPHENTVTIRLTREQDGLTYYQDYIVDFQRELTLEGLSVHCEGTEIPLTRNNGSTGFSFDVKEYSLKVSLAASSLRITALAHNGNTVPGEEDLGYRILIDGRDVTEAGYYDLPLSGTIETQDVIVRVENDKAPEGAGEYILHILKSPPVDATFVLTPETALLTVYEVISGQRLWADENGVYRLCEGYSYDYSLTNYGYVSRTGTLTVTRDESNTLVVKNGETSYAVTETAEGGGALTVEWSLSVAEKNPALDPLLPSQWPNFRGDETNNGIVDAPIPVTAESGTLYWANKIGEGYDANAVGSPILVNGELITYAGNTIYRIDPVNGEILKTGTMDHKSSFSITPPAYWEGMVFVALSAGTVQAFDAVTLESLWIYRDPLGGQPNCPLTIHKGYLYTGFWNSETSNANFVCLSVTDEDPSQGGENKSASWFHTSKGGYYWAGAYACDDYVLVGTDDGTNSCTAPSSSLIAFDPHTGRILDRLEGLNGDIRSTVAYDTATDAYYFTSKGGTFYSVKMSETDTGWSFTESWSVKLNNDSENPPMSTCTPAVYNGRAYVGVSGSGQFAAYSGHNITVIDLQDRAIAYRVQTQGYPQTSGLLTTAYEEENGYVYVYFFDNMTPGKLRVLRDRDGQTEPQLLTEENGYATAYALFTPTGAQAQYAICSPIADEYGTIYFKNDSAHLMAFGSAITELTVTKLPDKMSYEEGDLFDPAGMTVTATYANGKERDITKYVTFDTDPITENHKTISIKFPYVMYHNMPNGMTMNIGVSSQEPTVTLELVIDSGCASKGHTVAVDEAVPATCTEPGLTEGKHCTVCSEILLAQEVIPALGHSYVYATLNPLSHGITCENCNFSEESAHTYENGICICGEPEKKEPVEDPSLKLGHTLNLAGDISMNFAVSKAALAGFDMDTVYVESILETYIGDGKTETTAIRLTPADNGNYYYFTLTGLTAVQMKDRITSTLYGVKDGQSYLSPIDDYSIADYAYSQLSKAAASDSLKTLCADLLRYGTAAQIFKDYGTDNLADGDMTEEQKAYLSDIEAVTFGNTNSVLEDLENPPVTWSGKSLSLDSKVCLKFVFDPRNYSGEIADLTLRVSYEDMTGATKTLTLETPELYNAGRGYYAFTVDTLLAAELRAVVSVQVFAGEIPVSATLQYSADTYGNNKTGTLLDLCKALFAYSDSAREYFLK